MLLSRAMQYGRTAPTAVRLLPALFVTLLILAWRSSSRTKAPGPSSAREAFHPPVGRTTEITGLHGDVTRYTSSDFELEWVNHTRRDGICKLATSAAHLQRARDWL